MEKYLHGLNEKQKEAVLATEGPLLIVAGAGAGKTKTITHRIAHLIAKGVAPRSILAITFTNKAAKEMRERVEAMLPKEGGMPFVSTFHSLGVHILKHHGSVVGIPRFFAIYDKSDGKKIVKDALVAKNYDPKQFDPAKILGVISKEKGNFVSLSAYEEKVGNEFFPKVVATIWREYERRLKEEAALDFDDLLLVTATLLQKYPEVLMYYQDLWKYIHIDEYQDTNQVQYMIATLLAREHKNICAVGDTDQNIYSWRGAEIKNILHFEKDYPNAKIILLEENYRSTQTILAVANQIIKKNLLRIDKNLFTRNGVGERVGLFEAWSETHEAEFVVLKIQELMKTGVSPKEIAVLYRANFQSRALEEAFLSHTLPYQMVGTKFFERKEVKDVLSYIRASLNPQSLSDLKRIINSPTRGIGKTTAEKYFTGLKDSLPKAAKDKIANFESTLVKVRAAVATMKPSELIKYVIKVTGIEDELKAGGEEGLERLENIRELVTLGSRYDGSEAENGIEALLSDAALASDQDSLVKNEDAVKLMTVHASKGLEFDYVFVTGLEQDLFPHQRLDQGSISQDSSEEERRLFYVALTRARKKIFLTYSTMRTIFGSRQVNVPSEFILDIDPSFVEQEYILRDEDGRNPRIDIEF